MDVDHLLNERRIRREPISEAEVRQVLDRAERDLRTAEQVMEIDVDWGFAVAYNAVLQASRAYMFAHGFRPSSRESHKNVFAFMRIAVGDKHKDLITYFDRMRTKRHSAVYDTVGLITETEASNLLARARKYVKMIRQEIAGRSRRRT